MLRQLTKVPVSLFGAVMGWAAMGVAWTSARAVLGAPLWIGRSFGVIALGVFVVLCCAYAVKAACCPTAVAAEYADPRGRPMFGTIVVSLLLLPEIVAPYSGAAAVAIWSAGTVIMLGFAVVIVHGWLNREHALTDINPSWFIPVVGTLNVPLFGLLLHADGARDACTLALAIGTIFGATLFTLLSARLVLNPALPPAVRPSLVISVAPFAVAFSAFTRLEGDVGVFPSLLFYFALFLFVALLKLAFWDALRVPATKVWWSTTFPVAALANSSLTFAAQADAGYLRALAALLLAFGTLLVLAVSVWTIGAAWSGLRKRPR